MRSTNHNEGNEERGSRGEYKTSHNQILPRGFTKEVRREDKQGIEPSSSLIDTFRDEIGRESLLEKLLVLKRIMLLCVGHTNQVVMNNFMRQQG